MIAALRALLALVLLAGVYVLAVSVSVVWLAYAILSAWLLAYAPTPNMQPILMAAATFLPVMFIVGEVARMSRPSGPRPDSVLIPGKQAPGLRRAVAELAASVGTAPPDEIRLVADVNAFVTDDSWMLGLRSGHRRLYIGAPLLVGLRPDELKAILCHELGHFSRRHAWFTGPAFRGSAALARAREQIRDAQVANHAIRYFGWPVAAAVAAYAAIVNRLVLSIRRRQELEADRIAAAVAGPDALASALCSVAAVAVFWTVFEREFLAPQRKATGTVPDDPFHAFAVMLDDPECREPLSQARLRALEQAAPAGDPHPGLGERVAYLDRFPEPTDGTPTTMVFDVDERLFVRLAAEWDSDATPVAQAWPGWLEAVTDHRSVMPAGDEPAMWGADIETYEFGRKTARRMPWREWLAALAEHRATRVLTPLARAAREVGGAAQPTLETILDLLDHRRAMELARALDPGGARDQEHDWRARARLTAAVSALIGQALVRHGSAYWTMGWLGPSRLVATDADPAEIQAWVATAIDDPDQVAWLRMQLSSIGVDAATVAVAEAPGAGTPVRARTVKLTPAVPEATRERRKSTAYTALGMLLTLTCLGGVIYLGRDEPEPPYRPGNYRPTQWNPDRPATYPPVLPSGYLQPGPVLPSGLLERMPMPSLVVPLSPRAGG